MDFSGKKVLLGVCGGIAAYKAAFLVREFKKRGAEVWVMMTDSATRFVTPLTFSTLAGTPAAVDLFAEGSTAHIEWARKPDVVVICPATANTVAKLANGIADNLLTATVMAATAPLVICPAMNVEMYRNSAYRRNEERLRQDGAVIVTPAEGELACGEYGVGRLAEIDDVLAAVACSLFSTKDFQGVRFLVTAGPTREAIDPVRFISNRSSGKMGFALAEAAVMRGGRATLISGPTALKPPAGVEFVRVVTTDEMASQVECRLGDCDVLIMAAAPADFRPAKPFMKKIKKTDTLKLELAPTVDILQEAGRDKGRRVHVGFALETDDPVENALAKMKKKQCDLVVLNEATKPGAGFETDTNQVTLLFADGRKIDLPLMSKTEVAGHIMDAVKTLLQGKQSS